MEVLFSILFVLTAHLVHSVAVDQQNGFNPYPFGTTIFCIAQHPLLLVSSIYYLGWLWGSVLFLAHIFGIVHGTVSWILDIPVFLVQNDRQLFRFLRLKINLLPFALLANIVFTVSSFFIADFESLLSFFCGNPEILIVIAIAVTILSVARIVVAKLSVQNSNI